jgi:competence protein ComEC
LLMVPLEALASLDWATWEAAAPPAWAVACALVGCAWLLAPRGFPMRSCGLLWIAPLFVWPAPHPAMGEAWLDVLDVGQGLSVVVRTASHAWVFDAGPSWQQTDSGERIVVPYLRGEGIREVDGLLVSHRDDDHAGGAASVILARSPGWLLSSLTEDHPLRHAVEPSLSCVAGQRWAWDGVEFLVLHPGPEAYELGRRVKENDRGCVVRVIAGGGGAALLTADVEARGEAQMVRRDASALASQVLVVPHHGSRTSSTAELLRAVKPQVAVISLGFRNRFGHPHPAVVARYEAAGIPLRRTDLEGALRITLPAQRGPPPTVEALVRRLPYWRDSGRPP